VTPGNNTYGSYAEVISDSSVTSDAFGILININSVSVGSSARDAILTIGIDPAGGTTYTDFISDLLCSCAPTYVRGSSGAWYYFPVFIKAGTSIAAKGSVNNSTVGTMHVNVQLMCKPTRPELVRT